MLCLSRPLLKLGDEVTLGPQDRPSVSALRLGSLCSELFQFSGLVLLRRLGMQTYLILLRLHHQIQRVRRYPPCEYTMRGRRH